MNRLFHRLVDPLVAMQPQRRRVIKILLDSGIIFLSFQLAYFLRFDWHVPSEYGSAVFPGAAALTVLTIFAFVRLGAYSDFWVYWSLRDINNLIFGHTGVTLLLFLVNTFTHLLFVPRSIWLIYWFLSVVFFTGARVVARSILETLRTESGFKKRILIFGAGRTGQMLAWQILRDQSGRYSIAGFIDDDPQKLNRSIHGYRVIGAAGDIQRIVREKGIDQIIIAVPGASNRDMQRIVEACESAGVEFRTVPGPREILDGKVSVNILRNVRIEDLIGREKCTLHQDSIFRFIKGKTVLVTGAAGSIGSQLCREILTFEPARVVAVDKDENKLFYLSLEFRDNPAFTGIVANAANGRRMHMIMCDYPPAIVFHAAAYKHVPCMEFSPEEAITNNLRATMVLTHLAEKCGVETFVQISTDKAVNPSNMMGVSKRLCELYIASLNGGSSCRFISVRFGNVIGSVGSVFTIFEQQIREKKPVTVTDPRMTRFFMSIAEACKLVLESAAMAEESRIYVLNMGEPIRIIDLARQMIRLAGFTPDTEIKIEITGARPGEKVHEALWYENEQVSNTANESIYRVEGSGAVPIRFREKVYKILASAASMKTATMLDLIQEVVPEFQPGEETLRLAREREERVVRHYVRNGTDGG